MALPSLMSTLTLSGCSPRGTETALSSRSREDSYMRRWSVCTGDILGCAITRLTSVTSAIVPMDRRTRRDYLHVLCSTPLLSKKRIVIFFSGCTIHMMSNRSHKSGANKTLVGSAKMCFAYKERGLRPASYTRQCRENYLRIESDPVWAIPVYYAVKL